MKKFKLLSRLLVLIGVLIMNVSQVLADKTIYFVTSDNWSTVNCYAWQNSDGNNKNAAWPGVPMTSTGVQFNGHYVYSISLDDSHNKCIFNNGSIQTSNLDVPTDERNLYYKDYGFWGFRGPISSDVFSGDDVMFYIQGYGGKAQNYLVNESKEQASTSYKLTSAVSCVYTASSNLDTYDRISNNPGDWNGNQHTDIHDATGGELFREDGTSSTTKQTASTTASVTDGTLNISSTTSSATSAYSSLPIYIQYYIDGDFVGVTYSASTATYYSIPAGGSTARGSSLDVSGYAVGNYTLTTVLTDGILYWVADEDEFEVTSATSHAISYTTQSTGWTYGIKPSVGEEYETITFVVTPTDGYTVTVSSSDVELSGPNASNEYTFTMPDRDVDIDVSATENTYTITLVNATASSVTAGCATNPSITAASAPFGMAFDHWDVSGGASVANDHASSTTVSATAAGTVTAVYVQNLYAYVEGRFHIADASHSSWTNSFTEGNWGSTCTNIQFSYDEANHRFYLHTYATPKELSTQIDSNDPYFFIQTSTSNSSVTGGNAYHPTGDNNATLSKGVEQGLQTSSATWNLIFSSSDNSYYVTLYFDGTKVWYEYMPAIINTINLSDTRVPPMAEITATPSMYYKGATDKAYCWAVYSDEECTSPVNVSFTSLGSGRVQFTVPQTIGTYYLKLTVRASDACNASIDDEEVQSFNVTTDNMVFFNKTDIPWSGVFVYFLGDGSYWDDNLGSGCASKDYGRANEMHRIGKSDIYYYEYSGNALGNNDIQYIAFTEYGKPSSEHFAYTNAAYRGDFKRSCAPMYVPENWITHRLNNCEYYNRGYWTTYGVSGVARNAGFTLKVYDAYDNGSEVASEVLTNTDGSNTYRATVNLTNINWQYGFLLVSCANQNYGNSGKMVAGNSSGWDFEVDKHRCGVESQASGNYEFIVQCNDNGKLKVTVEYPLMNRDYRLIYNDTCVYQTGWHPSQFIRHNYSDGAKLDTVSMYIRPNKQPTLKIQVCDNASSNPPTWRDSITYDVSGLTNGHGVYNFYLSQEDGKLTINGVSPYTGLYYIRTQQADGGWTGYKTNSDNVMTYTEYAEQKNYGFNYYMTKWIGATGADVTFTIACDYSESLCDTMVADPGNNPLNASQARSIPHSASVRFGWNSLTNTLHRAYINGTSIVSDRYLVMIGDENLKDSEGEALAISGLNPNEIGFTDLNNWIYRCDVTAVTGAEVQLVGNYDGHTQHFIGTAEKPEEIIGGDSGKEYLMRVTYDFKTNRLMTAWLPDGDAITSNMTLNADMMLIREGQNAATQVYFGDGNKDKTINEIHSIYGVMEFQYSKFANQFPNWSAAHAYEYLMYYISFPFDVKVSEIFGVGVRGENWIIQKYNGAKRAQIGWFAETSTFWETLPGDSTLHAHEGYLLLLDRISFNDPGSNVWTNRPEKVYLYFPSASRTIGTIKDNNEKVTIKIPSHTCIIERPFTPDIDGWSGGELVHSNTDSHWNVFGTPLFQSKAATTVGDSELKYFYSWNYTNNTLRPEVTLAGDTVFKSMHGYMVQFAGDVTFTGAHISASVAARRMPSNKHYLAELQLVNENGDENATYVELRENANTDFQLNEDMYMMRSSNTVDLYSFAGAYDVAANVLPIDDQLVRVGVDVKRAGTYRFTMPSEFSGTVTLIDNLMGTRTNMALGDHEVYLERGVDNNRFLLEININKMPTAIDGVDGGSLKDGKAHKFIENGQMYILKDGIIYDARGSRVK